MKDKLHRATATFVSMALVFTLWFSSLRFVEWTAAVSQPIQLVLLGLLYDLAYAFFLSTLVGVVFFIFFFWNQLIARYVAIFLFSALLTVAFAVIQYFVTTNVPLSADFFGYSFSDVKTTVASSEGFSWGRVALLVGYVTLFVTFVTYVVRRDLWTKIPARLSGVTLFIMVIIGIIHFTPTYDSFESEAEYAAVVNKPQYFLSHSVSYLSNNLGSNTNESIGEYPFLHDVAYNDKLGNFFNLSNEPPNLVFIIVEGLGRDFTGPGATYGGFTPFLDSLSGKSLYWENGLSNAGRTFGVLPSLLGSLPYGKDGFMSAGVDMPNHHTLLSLLKPYGYTTNFFYGGNPNFDNLDLFLQDQGIDYMLNDSNFPKSYTRDDNWGYNDRDVLNYSLEVLNERRKNPRLDVYLTLTTHEPFVVPDETFRNKFDEVLNNLSDEQRKSKIRPYRDVISCLMFTDHSLKNFFHEYQSRPEYKNTLFIITGDHRLIPVPQATKLSRFRVPIMVYSPMIKAPRQFKSVVTHSDVTPSLLSLLKANYAMSFPLQMPFITTGIKTDSVFESSVDVALIRGKGATNDYIFENYYLVEGILFKMKSDLSLEAVENDSIKFLLQQKLKRFNLKSDVAFRTNKVDRPNSKVKLAVFRFSTEQKEVISEETNGLSPDAIFEKARAFALHGEYGKGRLLIKHLLNLSPNYHDSRVLLARTYSWNKQYDSARFYLNEVFSRAPIYEDAFNALSDIEYWQGNVEESLNVAEKGLRAHPEQVDLVARKARALIALNKVDEARPLLNDVLEKQSQHELTLELLKGLRP